MKIKIIRACMICKKIFINQEWIVDDKIRKENEDNLSHGMCPECIKNNYPELYERMLEKGKVPV